MKKSIWGKGVTTVKTSIEIPEDLWRAAKIRAIDERKNLQDVIADALTTHLRLHRKEPKKGGSSGT
jgi:hypothetical protein